MNGGSRIIELNYPRFVVISLSYRECRNGRTARYRRYWMDGWMDGWRTLATYYCHCIVQIHTHTERERERYGICNSIDCPVLPNPSARLMGTNNWSTCPWSASQWCSKCLTNANQRKFELKSFRFVCVFFLFVLLWFEYIELRLTTTTIIYEP